MLAQCWRNVSALLLGSILLAALFAALLRHYCGTLAAMTNSSKTVKSHPVCPVVIKNQATHQNKLTIKNHFASIRVSEGLSDVRYRIWCPVSLRQMPVGKRLLKKGGAKRAPPMHFRYNDAGV